MNLPHYNKVCLILDKLIYDGNDKKNNFKTVIFSIITAEDKYFKKIYCLASEILKNNIIIERILNEIYDKEFLLSSFNTSLSMLKILIYEIFLSPIKFKQGGRLIKNIKFKANDVKAFLEKNYNINKGDKQSIYFRLLTFKNIEHLKETKEIISGISIKDQLIKNLYILDKDCPIMEYDNYKKVLFELRDRNDIKIQSKSSCLPAYILYKFVKHHFFDNIFGDNCKKIKLIDSCAAPGNKTLQLADYFSKFNLSQIFAFDSNFSRFQKLEKNVLLSGYSDIISCKNLDFLSLNPLNEIYNDVKIILCDPSCSGSGTYNNSIENTYLKDKCSLNITSENEIKDRIKNLQNFQIKILKQCMKFPSVKLISYSTCSVYEEENEFVVDNILQSDEGKYFELVDLSNIFNENFKFHEGKNGFNKTIRTCRKCFEMEGFYIALFKRKYIIN